MTATPARNLRAHIFTNIDEVLIFKQSPNFSPLVDGVEFTCGLEVPEDTDVLLMYTRASYSVKTPLARNRTIFYAGEPDVIHPYSNRFLNQFGSVMTTRQSPLKTRKVQGTICSMPFVGINFTDMENPLPLEYFETLPCPKKDDRISIVTSTKTHTEYHRERLKFIAHLTETIPEYITLYGRGHKSVDDKKDALLDHKYHIALENGGGPDVWTEKLTDPMLCHAHPFYYGCTNVETYFPDGSYTYIDITNPEAAVNTMMRAREAQVWENNRDALDEGRKRAIHDYNLMRNFARLAHVAVALDDPSEKTTRPWVIRSERSLWPEKGARGSVANVLLRRSLQLIDPEVELRFAGIMRRIDIKKSERRAAKLALMEAEKN
ncbi:MAG: glycosyltransferase family 10 [Litoreibacter sp.]|uniref:glycosyltransferase family 10 domain-containing protein n=1 Tax=Litoreibacter sp. TaxID=1969459 RepID=UPI0032980573